MDNAKPLLPKLVEENQTNFPEPGKWQATSQNTLTNLVKDLDVAPSQDSHISSIPDVWARPQIYTSILSDSRHTLHDKYIQEWRGIMAILALRLLRRIEPISVYSVDIYNEHDVDQLNIPAFQKVLSHTIPDEYLKNQEEKKLNGHIIAKIHIITFNERPLAICWPTILVCPAMDLSTRCDRKVPWWKEDGLHDPLYELSDDEKNGLYAWLNEIENNLDSQKECNEILIKLLRSYKEDIKDNLNKEHKFQEHYPFQQSTTHPLGITGFAYNLNYPISGTVGEDFLQTSDICLINQKNTNAKNVLIISPDIDTQWNCNPSDIIVGGPVTASALMNRLYEVKSDHYKLGDNVDLTKFNAEIHLADEVFTDNICVIDLGIDAFPGALSNHNNRIISYNGRNVNIILPIKPWILDYLNSEYIAKNIEILSTEQGLKVVFSLPVSGKMGKLNAVKYYKDTSSQSDITFYQTVPVLQVWPNFTMSNPEQWQAYYSYYGYNEEDETFYAKPIWGNEEDDSEERPVRHITIAGGMAPDKEIRRGHVYPEAFSCHAKLENRSGQMENVDLGLILLKKVEQRPTPTSAKTCEIGIDFGTTNTVAYIKEGNDTPTPIKLKNRSSYITYTEQANDKSSVGGRLRESDRTMLRQDFIPESEQPNGDSSSIKSMFHTYQGEIAGSFNSSEPPLFLGNIYYLDGPANIDDDGEIQNDVQTDNMKWNDGNNSSGLNSMLGFLMQLGMQCMAEAIYSGVNQINWSYSYPIAFTFADIMKFERLWDEDIYSELSKISNIKMGEPKKLTESAAVAAYFVKGMKATPASGMVCIDIGGGSTDIAVWQGRQTDNMQKQASIRFAGRDILNKYLLEKKENNHDILSLLVSTNPAFTKQIEKLNKANSEKAFDMQLEALLKYNEEETFKALSHNDKIDDVSILIRDISFALAGIFFYVGILVGYLRKKDTYTESKYLPKCYIGGNASKLLRWAVAGGNFDKKSYMNGVFQACFSAGMESMLVDMPDKSIKDKKSFAVIMTANPKEEVAYGLMTNASDIDKDLDDDDDETIAGEYFTVEDSGKESNEIITRADVLGYVTVNSNNVPAFLNFLEVFNKRMKKLGYTIIEYDDDMIDEICRQVTQTLTDACNIADGDEDEVVLEPLFILLLKEFYKYLAQH